MNPLRPIIIALLATNVAFAAVDNEFDEEFSQVTESPFISADKQATQLAESAKSLGHLTDYEDAMRDLVKRYPSSSKAHYWLAYILHQKKHYLEAVEHFRQAIQFEPTDQTARLDYAQTLADLRRYDEAIEQVEFVLRLDPQYFLARSHLASLYVKQGRIQEAIDQYIMVQQAAPNHPKAQEAASRLQLLYIREATELSKTIDDTNKVEDAVNAAHVWIKQKHTEPAIWLLNQIIEKHPENADANYLLGFTLLQDARLGEALPYLKKAITSAPRNQRYLSIYAQTLARAGKLNEAEEVLRRLLTVTADPAAEKLAFQRLNLVTGENFLKNGHTDEALEQYFELLDNDKNNIPILSRISDIYLSQGKEDKAQEIQDRIKSAQDLKKTVNKEFAQAKSYISGGELNKAEALLIKITREFPSHAEAYYQLAVVKSRQKEFHDAIKYMNRSISLAPENELLRKEFARLLVHAGQLKRARAMYQQLADTQDIPSKRKEFLRLAQHVVGQGLLQQKNLEKALEHYQLMSLQFVDDLSVLDAIASIYTQLNLYDDALDTYKLALKKNATRASTHIRLGTLYGRMKNDELRRYHFAQAIKNDLLGQIGKSALDRLLLNAKTARNKRNYQYALDEYETVLSILPSQEAAAAGAAYCAMQLDKFETSRKYYLRVLQRFPNEMSIRVEYARLLIRTNELDKAIEEFESIFQRSPRSVEGLEANANLDILYNSRADEYIVSLDKLNETQINDLIEKMRVWILEKKRPNAAQRLLLKIVEIAPQNSKAHFWLGHIYDQLRDFDNAIMYISKSISMAPENLQLQAAFARVLARSGNLPMAQAIYRKILRLTPNSTLGQETKMFFDFIIGQQLIQSHQLDKALEHYQNMLKQKPYDAGIMARIGTVYLNQKRYHLAKKTFDDVAKLQPKSPSVHFQLAVLYFRMGKKEEQELELRKVVELDPRGTLGRKALDQLGLSEGMKFLLSKEWKKAIVAFQDLLQIDPNNTSARIGMASAYYELEKYEDALSILGTVTKIDPSNMRARLELARVLVKVGNIDEAAFELERVVAAVPDTRIGNEAVINLTNIYKERARALLKQGHGDEAVAEYQKSIDVYPQDWEAHYELARIFQSGSRTAAGKSRKQFMDIALIHYSESIKYNPMHYFSYLNSAAIYEELQQYEEAQRAYAYALANMLDQNETVQIMLANAIRLQGVRAEFAAQNLDWVIEEMKDMLTLEPNNARLHLFLSTVYLRLEDIDNAIAQLRIVVDLTPDNVAARYRLGQILEQDADLVLAADQYRGILLTGQSGGIIEAARERLLSVEERLRLFSVRMSFTQTAAYTRGDSYANSAVTPPNPLSEMGSLRFNIAANIRPIKRLDLSLNASPTLINYNLTGYDNFTPVWGISTRYTHRKGSISANINRFDTGPLDSEEPVGTETNGGLSVAQRLKIPLLFSEVGATSPSTVTLGLNYRNFNGKDISFYRITSYSANLGLIYPFQTGGALQANLIFTDTRPNLTEARDYANFSNLATLNISKPLATRLYGSIGLNAEYDFHKYADSFAENNGRKRQVAQLSLNASLSYQLHRKLSLFMDFSLQEQRSNLSRGVFYTFDINNNITGIKRIQSGALGDFRTARANAGIQFQF